MDKEMKRSKKITLALQVREAHQEQASIQLKRAEAVRNARMKQGMSVEQLAARCDVSLSTIRSYERGEVGHRARSLDVVEAALGLDRDDPSPRTDGRMERYSCLTDEDKDAVDFLVRYLLTIRSGGCGSVLA